MPGISIAFIARTTQDNVIEFLAKNNWDTLLEYSEFDSEHDRPIQVSVPHKHIEKCITKTYIIRLEKGSIIITLNRLDHIVEYNSAVPFEQDIIKAIGDDLFSRSSQFIMGNGNELEYPCFMRSGIALIDQPLREIFLNSDAVVAAMYLDKKRRTSWIKDQVHNNADTYNEELRCMLGPIEEMLGLRS